jgi:hypothetical protein
MSHEDEAWDEDDEDDEDEDDGGGGGGGGEGGRERGGKQRPRRGFAPRWRGGKRGYDRAGSGTGLADGL